LNANVERELSRFGAVTGIAPAVEAWPAAVGVEIARNAWPARVGRDGTLLVHTSSSAWAFELAQLEERIRASLGEHAPPRLRFVVGPIPEPTLELQEDRRHAPKPSPRDAALGAKLASEIDDESLRKIVAKTAALSLAAADSDR
jgi:hypothetical protein